MGETLAGCGLLTQFSVVCGCYRQTVAPITEQAAHNLSKQTVSTKKVLTLFACVMT